MTTSGDRGAADRPVRRWPRWMGMALVASLAFNLLVIGAVATAAWRHRPWDARIGSTNIYAFTHRLPAARRDEVLGLVAAERQQLRPFRAELRRARAEVRAAIAASPFDAGRYSRANDAMLSAETGARKAAHVLFDAIVLKLSDGERARLAQWLERADRSHRAPSPWWTP